MIWLATIWKLCLLLKQKRHYDDVDSDCEVDNSINIKTIVIVINVKILMIIVAAILLILSTIVVVRGILLMTIFLTRKIIKTNIIMKIIRILIIMIKNNVNNDQK